MDDADSSLLHSIIENNYHVLQRYLPDNPDSGYNLRPRRHSKTSIDKTTDLNTRNFLLCMLYKDCY